MGAMRVRILRCACLPALDACATALNSRAGESEQRRERLSAPLAQLRRVPRPPRGPRAGRAGTRHKYKGPVQVVRQVWSVRYQGELLGLCGTLKLVILVENHPHNPDFSVG